MKNKDGSTPLHLAAGWPWMNQNLEICKSLIDKKPDLINAVDNRGLTALHYATISGQEKICELIIKEHPQLIDVIDNNGKIALDTAKSVKSHEIIKLITTKLTQIQQEKLLCHSRSGLPAWINFSSVIP